MGQLLGNGVRAPKQLVRARLNSKRMHGET